MWRGIRERERRDQGIARLLRGAEDRGTGFLGRRILVEVGPRCNSELQRLARRAKIDPGEKV